MKLVKAWRVVTEVRELGEHMGKGLARQDTGGGVFGMKLSSILNM